MQQFIHDMIVNRKNVKKKQCFNIFPPCMIYSQELTVLNDEHAHTHAEFGSLSCPDTVHVRVNSALCR